MIYIAYIPSNYLENKSALECFNDKEREIYTLEDFVETYNDGFISDLGYIFLCAKINNEFKIIEK